MSDAPAQPTTNAEFRVRKSLWYAADLVNDPLLEIPENRKADLLVAITQAIALESIADSLDDIKQQLGNIPTKR